MMVGGVLILAYALIDAVLITPAGARSKAVLEQLAQRRNEIAVAQAQLQVRSSAADPDAANRARLAELRKQIVSFETQAKEQSAQLISAERMRSVLQEMIASRPGLELVELRNLPESTLSVAGDAQKGAAKQSPSADKPTQPGEAGVIYKHGVELTVRGRYLDLLAYLKEIEALPVRLYWYKLEMKVVEHPTVSMHMTIYTISLDKAWIQV